MHFDLIFVIEYALIAACTAFAYFHGGQVERMGAIWFGVNMIVSAMVGLARLGSPVVQLVQDGIFALGLLPLTMIYVSYWMGALTMIAAALFTLEAMYLLADRPADLLYVWVNNILWLLAPLVFLVCGIMSMRKNRRAAREEREARKAEAVAVGG